MAISTISGCVSISDFAFLVGITIGITSSTTELKICVMTAAIKMYKLIIKKKGRIMIKKSKLINTEVLISKALTLSWWRPLSYRNQFIDLLRKSMDWFLYDNGLRHERVN